MLACVLAMSSQMANAHSENQTGSGGSNEEEPKPEPCDGEGGSPSSCDCQSEGDPISLYNGKLFLRETDLEIDGVYPIRMVRRYDNHARYDSPLGYGWAFTYDKRLYKYPDNSVIVRRDCGVRDRYVFQGGAYQPPLDRHTTLVEEVDGSFTLTQQNGSKEFYDLDGKLTALQDRQGNRLEMSYDPSGRLPLTGTSKYALDPNSPSVVAYDYRLTDIKERLRSGTYSGNEVTLVYDAITGRLQSITASDGRQVTYLHDTTVSATHGNLLTVNGLDGIVSTYQYTDADTHNVTSMQVGAGTTPHVNVYDSQDRVISQTHGNHLLQFAYGIDTTVTETIKDNATPTPNVLNTLVTVYSYDQYGFPSQITRTLDDGTVYRQTYLRNGQQRMIEDSLYETPPLGTEVLVRRKTFTWDTAGNQLSESIVLASGEIITTTRTFDHSWVASEETVSDARPTEIFRTEYTFYYDAGGVPINIREEKRRKADGSFLTTAHTYDAENRLLSSTLPDGHKLVNVYTGDFLTKTYHEISGAESPYLKQQFGYDARGNRIQITDAKNQTTQMDYDDQGRLIKITNPLGEETHYRYTGPYLTEIEQGTTVAEGEGQITRLNYSPEGFLESIDRKDDDGVYQRFITYTLDSRGKRLSAADALNRTTLYTYDALGRLLTTSDPLGKVTQYQYDALDNRKVIIDAKLTQTLYQYDALSRLTQIEQQGITPSAITQMSYDAMGNLLNVTGPESHTTGYIYDRLSRNTQVIQPLTQTLQLVYDDRDRIDYILNARGQKLDFDYELWGPLKEAKYYPTASATTADRTVSYSLDFNGNITGVTDDTIQPGSLYTVTHDVLDRPDVTTIKYLPGGDRTLDNDYDRFGNRDTLTVTDGGTLVHSFTYNKLNRLDSASLPGNQAFGFAYYANDDLQILTYPNGVTGNYSYATNGPVNNITYTGTSGNLEQLAYIYDDVLNVDTLTDLADGLHDFGYDNLNRLTQALHPTTNGLPGSEDYGYDKVGNREHPTLPDEYQYDNNNRITASPGLTYTFDDDGNTTSRSDGAVLTYTHENRLASFTKGATTASYVYDPMGRRIKKTANGVTTWYLWEGNDLLGEYDGSGNRSKRYAYLPDGFAPSQMEDAGGTVNVHNDHLDTPKLMTDATQAIVWQGRQEAFGNTLVDATSTVELNIRFPGQYYDVETGLHYNLNRYLDPKTGRYITSDPIGLVGGINIYTYALNNPLRYTDPEGLAVPVVIAACLADPPCAAAVAAGAIATGMAISNLMNEMLNNDDVSDGSDDPEQCDDDTERCKKIKQQCIDGCSDFVLQKPKKRRKDLGGMDFHFCVRLCMDRNGC
jgi:RHS repeat-associated protein